MKLKYLGTFYPTEIHSQGQPYETSTDVMMSDRDTADTYPLDEICRANTAWTGDIAPFNAVYQESYSQVLWLMIDCDTWKAWRRTA